MGAENWHRRSWKGVDALCLGCISQESMVPSETQSCNCSLHPKSFGLIPWSNRLCPAVARLVLAIRLKPMPSPPSLPVLPLTPPENPKPRASRPAFDPLTWPLAPASEDPHPPKNGTGEGGEIWRSPFVPFSHLWGRLDKWNWGRPHPPPEGPGTP